MKWFSWLALVVVALFAVSVPLTVARAASTVSVTIEVYAASKSGSGYAGPAKRYQRLFSSAGYKSARRLDTLHAANRPVGSSVEMKFRDPKGKERKVVVKVEEASGKTVRLHISVPSIRFATHTKHTNGGSFVVHIKQQDLFLAVRPK